MERYNFKKITVIPEFKVKLLILKSKLMLTF